MTPVQRVRRARTMLAGTVVVAAGLWAAVAGMAVLTLMTLADTVGLLPPRALPLANLVAGMAALGAAAAVVWRERAVWSVERVALWLEERAPELQYALVTVIDPRYTSNLPASASAATSASAEGHAALLRATARTEVERLVRHSGGRTLARAAVATVMTGVVVVLVHGTTLSRRRGAPIGARPVTVLGNRLTPLRVEVVPPAYSGLPRKVLTEPTVVTGLHGTRMRMLGAGPPTGVVAIVPTDTLARDTLAAVAAGRGWVVAVPMPALPGVLRLEDRHYHRALSLEPIADSVPRVLLRMPARDTTWRWDQPPTGALVLEAELEDDYGIDRAFFEILVSVGSAENFDTKDRSTPPVRFGGQRRGTLRTTIDYRALMMTPGTVLHIRAVAYDNNDVADHPGRGVSETRTLRVATKQESDTTFVSASPPPPIDSFFVSQRLLNMRTDTLLRVKKAIWAKAQYRDTALAYSVKQNQIRQRVEDVIANVEDDGVGGRIETDLSRLLRAASEEMYGAYMFLAIAMPDSAYLPPKSHMKEALRLLDEARKAQKYYVRGLLGVRPVNIARARLQGGDSTPKPKAADRKARDLPEDVRRELRQRLASAAAAVVQADAPVPGQTPAQASSAALEPLLQVKSAALRLGAREVAAALQEAIDAAAQRKSAMAGLARARRLIERPTRAMVGPAEWGGGMLP